MTKFLIYALLDPRDGRCRYIGKSSIGMRRARMHEREAQRGQRGHCANWIRQLLSQGEMYTISVVEEHEAGDVLCERERWWIAFARAWGCSLTNMTDGGEGLPGFRHRQETKARQSASCLITNATPETRQRRREACSKSEWKAAHGRPDVRARVSASVTALWADPESREKYLSGSRRAWSTPETRARLLAHRSDARQRDKIRDGVLAAYARPGVRERQLAALSSPEVKKRISNGVRAARARQRVLAVQWGPL